MSRLTLTFLKIFRTFQNPFSERLSIWTIFTAELIQLHGRMLLLHCTPKDNRSFIATVNSRVCTVGNIARGNNQFVVTLENFISTRRQKAWSTEGRAVKYIAIIYNRTVRNAR